MSLAALERRLSRLEAGQPPPRQPHEHACKLYLLGGDNRPSDSWVNEQTDCAGCDDPESVRVVVWPPGAWPLL